MRIVCQSCGQLVNPYKPLLGGLHFCVNLYHKVACWECDELFWPNELRLAPLTECYTGGRAVYCLQCYHALHGE